MNNAIQALAVTTHSPKYLMIVARKLPACVELSVADNADGISKENQTQLFELLTGTKHTGMGLGLWLCKHIVTRHGGSIRFEENEGGGAKFVVNLPAP
ncbi:ATP-binding protein [Polynucleobacter necessarius]|uniref:ATP-binding protein n=1 Tax=Polynucleobacter necessarius TaxID=576610 RepID=UPI001E2D6037|nr:ATP-binding protein [Polynucleobacter necessarius]